MGFEMLLISSVWSAAVEVLEKSIELINAFRSPFHRIKVPGPGLQGSINHLVINYN